jgi:Ca-activated chloride channel family protein
MALIWPRLLFLLGLIPLLIAIYVWMLRRRRRYAVRYSSLALVREAVGRQTSWRRHIPFALFLLALSGLVVAVARPVMVVTVPTDQTTIILTIDVSGSMRSRDVYPTRMLAAENAAINFVQHQKPGTLIGLVAFSNFAEEIQQPTADQEALQAAIESLTTGRRTAIGGGILKAIDAIAEVDKNVAPSVTDTSTAVEPTPVPKGDYAPDIIVVLTDGVSNTGPLPTDAAKQAADRGIRVYTIGFGTANGNIDFGQGGGFGGNGGGNNNNNNNFGGSGNGGGGNGGFFGGGGGGFRMGIDEATLKQVASMTGGKYYIATSATELESVFSNLPTYLIIKHETSEISVLFAAAGGLLVLLAIILSLVWHPLP